MLKYEKIKATEKQITTLFDLLSHRRHSISHIIMPVFADHKAFVLNNPYREWYLVRNQEVYIGSFYLTYENHISVTLLPDKYHYFRAILSWILKTFPVLPEIKSVRPPTYQMNVPISDNELSSLLEQLGLKKIQVTYKLDKNID